MAGKPSKVSGIAVIILAVVAGLAFAVFVLFRKASPNPTVPGKYTCITDSDCSVKNVGNGCGYYPDCVRNDYEPNPPELQSNVCGFPSIDHCRCHDQTCTGVSPDGTDIEP